jgi:hypothetical protein
MICFIFLLNVLKIVTAEHYFRGSKEIIASYNAPIVISSSGTDSTSCGSSSPCRTFTTAFSNLKNTESEYVYQAGVFTEGECDFAGFFLYLCLFFIFIRSDRYIEWSIFCKNDRELFR